MVNVARLACAEGIKIWMRVQAGWIDLLGVGRSGDTSPVRCRGLTRPPPTPPCAFPAHPTMRVPVPSQPLPPTGVRPEREGVEPPRLSHLVEGVQVGVHVVGVVGVSCTVSGGLENGNVIGMGRTNQCHTMHGGWDGQEQSSSQDAQSTEPEGTRGTLCKHHARHQGGEARPAGRHQRTSKCGRSFDCGRCTQRLQGTRLPTGAPGLCLEVQSRGCGMCLLGRRSGLDSSSTRSKPDTCAMRTSMASVDMLLLTSCNSGLGLVVRQGKARHLHNDEEKAWPVLDMRRLRLGLVIHQGTAGHL